MRIPVAVALVMVSLGLAGCSLFGKKQAAHTKTDPKPFLGAEAPGKADAPAIPTSSSGPLPGANGLLAGYVVSNSSGGPVKAYIQVKDLEEEDTKAAGLEVESDPRGFFTIPNLRPRGHYRLLARAAEGGELVSNYAFVSPPNPTILLQLSKRGTTNTPPVPDPPKAPGKKGTSGTESSQERIPATTLDPPQKIQPGKDIPPPPESSMGANPGGNSGNIANIAEGFPRSPAPRPPTADVSIPPPPHRSAPWPPPPPAQWESVPDDRSAPPASLAPQPKPPGSVRLPDVPTHIPSCGLYGGRLDNLALRNEHGQPWEYKRDFHGKLLLLDFWQTSCQPCMLAIHHLVELQRVYQPYGLEVIGIACEAGTPEQQRARVLSVRGRYHINYKTLISGGVFGNCPVYKQFQIDRFPTLVLIDESGKIIWRYVGYDENAYKALNKIIENKLLAPRATR